VKSKCSKSSFEIKLTPSKVKIEKICTPAMVNDENTEGSFLGRLEHKTGKDYTDIAAGFSYGLPKLQDNVGLWFEGNVITNNLKSFAGDLSAVGALNNQWFVGTKVVGDLKAQKLSEAHGFVAVQVDNNFGFLLSNCLERKIKLGFWTQNIEYFSRVAAETNIELDDKYGLKGSPTSTVAFEHQLNDDSKLKVKFDIAKDIYTHFSFVHTINKNLQITITDECNPLGFFRNSGKEQYKLGVAFEANL
jgi:hypothetical protein